MAWFNCTVNQVGVLNYGGTPNPNVLINLVDADYPNDKSNGGWPGGAWFSVSDGTQAAMLSLALVAVTNNKHLAVGADPPPLDGNGNPVDGPYPVISNFYLLA
jgi:hypothetical protein